MLSAIALHCYQSGERDFYHQKAQKQFRAPGGNRTHDPLSSTHLAKFSHRGLYADQKGAQGQYSSFPLCNRYQPQLSVRF